MVCRVEVQNKSRACSWIEHHSLPCRVAPTAQWGGVPGECHVPGTLYNTNTAEAFKEVDKKRLLAAAAAQLWKDLVVPVPAPETPADESKGGAEGKDGHENGAMAAAMRDPSLLARFILLAFADLKKHSFVHWFAFPALSLDADPKHYTAGHFANVVAL